MLGLNFVIDPRVQGTVTLASFGSIPKKDILPVFESVMRMSNAAVVREGNLVKIVPIQVTEQRLGDGLDIGALEIHLDARTRHNPPGLRRGDLHPASRLTRAWLGRPRLGTGIQHRLQWLP